MSSLLFEKTKEVTQTLLPVVGLVLLLTFTIVDVESDIMMRFIVGSFLLLIGLALFLFGIDRSMNPIGEQFSHEVATSKTVIKILILSFLLGFLITIAEPDLLILGNQIEEASGGSLGSSIIVNSVSVGVGMMISFGVFNLLRDKPLNRFMAIVYTIILALALFVSEEFLAIAFDSSGATTGALTTPFILALSLGLSKVKGGKNTEENSFGLVGVMSSGPILAVMLLSIITGQKNIQGAAGEYVFTSGIFGPILEMIPHTFMESLFALIPIVALFFIYNFVKFKLPKAEMWEIIQGLFYTLIGLVLFLTGVNSGFMDMGRIIGMQLADAGNWLLILVAFGLGLIVVLVEPAVHVLGEQIEDVTGGHISSKIIKSTLSIGVGIAVALSMVRIVVPEVQLWWFLFPGFLLAIILSFRVDPIFVGIAYDAGGVASGPMTATFVLAFAQGAATQIPTANVLVDGFGVIAMVAMTPVLSIMLLGTIFKHREVVKSHDIEDTMETPFIDEMEFANDCMLVMVNRGYAESVIQLARKHGATGATVLHGRGFDVDHKMTLPILNLELHPEREMIMFVMGAHKSAHIATTLVNSIMLINEADIDVYLSPADPMMASFVTHEEAN